MDGRSYSVGLVGTGYIAQYHAKALQYVPGAALVAACDVSARRASDFAAAHNIAAYGSVEAMLENEALDVVHVLTPPQHHFAAGRTALDAGVHLFVEKPLCTQAAECECLLALAEQRGVRLGTNHNFLFHSAYERLRNDVRGGLIGAIDHIAITWAMELPQIRSGPFDTWVLQDPTHVLLEIGPHGVAPVLDLAMTPEVIRVHASDPVGLPGNRLFYRRWQIAMACGPTAVDLYFSFAPGFARRAVQVSGSLGTAVADLERNTYILQRHGRYLQDFGKYEVLSAAGRSLCRQARNNLTQYVLSKLGLSREGNAFAASIERSIRAFYEGLSGALDPRCSGQIGGQVVEQCTHLIARAGIEHPVPSRVSRYTQPAPQADALVLGGTGFIGRELVRRLLESGQHVRVLTRGRTVPFAADEPNLQILSGDVRDPADLARAVHGVRNVYHLARSGGGSWKDYYEQDVIGTEKVADCCLDAGVRRLVYTSSIVGYSLAGPGPVTEQTPFDAAILRQNKYARAKAEAELRLLERHRTLGLPVVIVRPGMVIGPGGDLCHGGLGTWNGLGSCTFWGNGEGKLPLVLVEDVARGLIAAMDIDGIEGQVFNLVDAPLLSARQYVEEIERFAGIRISTFSTPIWTFFAADLVKWLAKLILRVPGRYVPTYGMWKGRKARATFDCSKAKTILGWAPAGDRDALTARGIHVHLVEFTSLQASEQEAIRQVRDNLEVGQMKE